MVGGVPPRLLIFIDPGWWNEFGDTIGGEDDRPVAFLDFRMMMPAKQTAVFVSTFAVMDPVDHVVGVTPGDRSVTPRKCAAVIP